jgi:predicted DNA-binding protein (MmcQ/YjbR family)
VHDDPGPPTAAHAKAEAKLREFALAYPEVTEEFPWGERALKVRGKTFLFMRADGNGLGLSTKLPESRDFALTHAFAASTGYGLGKAGWVSASFPRGTRPPTSLLCEWIDESYRAIAPKGLVKQLPK